MRVGLGVGGAVIASGSRARPTHSCDRWVFDLGVVGVSSIFGWVRGVGAFVVLPTFVLVSRMKLTQQYRDNDHFLSAASPSRHKTMVGDDLARLRLCVSTWVSVGRPSTLDRVLTNRIRGFLTC